MTEGNEERLERLWLVDPSEANQVQLTSPLPGDDALVHLTAYEAEKCQAVLNGYLDGLVGYETGVRQVAFLLSVRALTAKQVPHQAADPWPAIDALPWPLPPGLRPDPDH